MTNTKTISTPVATDENLAMPATPSVTVLTTVETETPEANPDHENMFSKRAKIVAAKAVCSGIARQSLAEANDYYNNGQGFVAVANQSANVAAKRLIQGQIEGLFDKNEVNAILGDIFGYKPKSDGTPGKTPDGYGEAIRKRIVRLVSAIEHVETVSKVDYIDETFQSAEKFFCGVPAKELEEIVLATIGGEKSIWTAYDDLAEAKKEYTEKTDNWLVPAKVQAMISSLIDPERIAAIKADGTLLAVYDELLMAVAAIADANVSRD